MTGAGHAVRRHAGAVAAITMADGCCLGTVNVLETRSRRRGAADPPATVHQLFTDPGAGVSGDTASLAQSAPSCRTLPPAQENR
ncbi:hypothetical protein [Streptomyces antarcticus]|uniref:hypothetical protein n=1 Tax=Streptomyces antarcticus TaxID=2996458 RepID=UPI00226D781F|nr:MULTISPECIES: hypothetical protein [unclassified Streptomyces]MCY0946870.1 hypothetical protein [Streptomyces sp. H34-AA3]MCZ4085630.1 hypothetical protein [Streptomyces sp. H34-S5]